MKLYFLRHADALDGDDDAVRPLSPHGKNQARGLARFLQRAEIEFDAAYSSPLVRARQTAEIVLEICGSVELKITGALLNETSQSQFEAWLAELPNAKRVLLVGHAPTLAERVQQLIGITSSGTLDFPKAGLVCLETGDCRAAKLRFFITPKLLGVRAE